MNRQVSSATRLAAALLIVGIVAVACGRPDAHQATGAAGQDPAVAATPVAPTLEPAPTATDVAAEPSASDPATPAATYAPPDPANDPVTGEMQSIDQLLKGIDGSLSGADPGSTGGE